MNPATLAIQEFCETLTFYPMAGISVPPSVIPRDLLKLVPWQCICGISDQVSLTLSEAKDLCYRTSFKTRQINEDLYFLHDGCNLFAYNTAGELVFNPCID